MARDPYSAKFTGRYKMEYIRVTKDNLEKEHICCAIADEKDAQVLSKKTWLRKRFDDGLVFLKGNVRGKCFIEYIPAENAWAPIEAEGYLYIDCLWVSGSLKGHGYANDLLDACMEDGRKNKKKGLVILSSEKKEGFLADRKFLEHKGFTIADRSNPHFLLMYLPFTENAEKPHFGSSVKDVRPTADGYVLYYTDQCPFTAKYVPLLKKTAEGNGVLLQTVHIDTKEEAQAAPCPFTTFALYKGGRFITHEIQSPPKFLKIIGKIQ